MAALSVFSWLLTVAASVLVGDADNALSVDKTTLLSAFLSMVLWLEVSITVPDGM
jgi:hypothetical protein